MKKYNSWIRELSCFRLHKGKFLLVSASIRENFLGSLASESVSNHCRVRSVEREELGKKRKMSSLNQWNSKLFLYFLESTGVQRLLKCSYYQRLFTESPCIMENSHLSLAGYFCSLSAFVFLMVFLMFIKLRFPLSGKSPFG